MRKLAFLLVLTILCLPNIPAKAQTTPKCQAGSRLLMSAMVTNGPLCIPESPKRIAAVDTFTLETLIALGIKPVSGPFLEPFNQEHPQLKEQTAGITDTGWPLNLETLLKGHPDLIISIEPWISKVQNDVARIAPTVSIKYEADAKWKDIAQTIGEAINQPEAVNGALATYEARLKTFRDLLVSQPVGDVSIVFIYPDGMQAFVTDQFSAQIVQEAGLHFPKAQLDALSTGWDGSFSKERFDLLQTSDHIFVLTSSFTAEDVTTNQKLVQTLDADPLWQSLPAVKAGHIHLVGRDWLGSSFIAANAVLDDLFTNIANVKLSNLSPDPFLTAETQATAVATQNLP